MRYKFKFYEENMMKKIFCFVLLVAFQMMPVYSATLDVKGQISKELQHMQIESENNRLNRDSLGVMTVKKGLGKELITQKLLEEFKNGVTITTKTVGDWMLDMRDDLNNISGSDWNLTVFGDGSRVNYRNWGYTVKNKAKYGKDKEMSLSDLKGAGLKFIKEELNEFIKLGKGEELVFLRSIYQVDTIGSDDMTFIDETLVSNIAVFGRVKDGLLFVGGGSKIIVEFSNDRKPVAFYYDWVDYNELNEFIEIASQDEINYRIASFSSMNYGDVKNLSVEVVCGYYDDSEYVQPACEVKQSGELADGDFVALINIIPAGKTYYLTDSWGELNLLNNFGEICRESDISQRIFPEDEKKDLQ